MSTGGAAYFCGKGADSTKHNASIKGAIAGAHFIKAVAPEYGIPVILHTDHCPKKDLPWLEGMLDVYIHPHSRSERQLTSVSVVRAGDKGERWKGADEGIL